jgi:anti-sigma B factor antagonist
MALEFRNVTVKQLPETVNEDQEWAFLEEMKMSVYAERPRVVLNCSRLAVLKESTLHLLLSCLEEAMKRNGDVRLSALTKPAKAVLDAAGLGRLFKVYESDTEAVKSFQRHGSVMTLADQKAMFSSDTEINMENLPLQSAEDAA